jgi:syntaxin 5
MKDFQSACENRHRTLEQQQKRRNEYGYRAGGPLLGAEIMGNQSEGIEMGTMGGGGGGAGGSFRQMQKPNEFNYSQGRADAMKSVQKVIGELGVMFKKMADLVAEQEYQTQRIGHDIEQIDDNVTMAQQSLLQYFNNMSGNRMLILKMFAIMIFFVVFYIIFLS